MSTLFFSSNKIAINDILQIVFEQMSRCFIESFVSSLMPLASFKFVWLQWILHPCHSSYCSLSKLFVYSSISSSVLATKKKNTLCHHRRKRMDLFQVNQGWSLFSFKTVCTIHKWLPMILLSAFIFRFPNLILTRIKQAELKAMHTLQLYGEFVQLTTSIISFGFV